MSWTWNGYSREELEEAAEHFNADASHSANWIAYEAIKRIVYEEDALEAADRERSKPEEG